VMLNSLIAIMSDTFERVQQNTTAASRQERAKIILELEALLYPAGGDESSVIQRVICVLLSRKFGTTSPPFLHVLEPKNRDSEDDGEWQGRIRVLFTKFDKAERAQQQLDATVKTQVAAVQSKMDQMQVDTEKQAATAQSKMQTMEDKMDQMQAVLQAILAASQMTDRERTSMEKKRLADAKAAEEKRLVQAKAAEEKRLAEAMAAEERRRVDAELAPWRAALVPETSVQIVELAALTAAFDECDVDLGYEACDPAWADAFVQVVDTDTDGTVALELQNGEQRWFPTTAVKPPEAEAEAEPEPEPETENEAEEEPAPEQ
jgi:hypothetical protein